MAAAVLPDEPIALLDDGAVLAVTLNGERHRFHALWLRDNAQDGATRSPANGQRLITLLDIPPQTRIADARSTGAGLRLRFQPEGKDIDFSPDWLRAHSYDALPEAAIGWTGAEITRWDGSLSDGIEIANYQAVRDDDEARRRWLGGLRRHGLARLRDAPITSEVACMVADLFGYVRETNYGRAFDVRISVDPANLADTNLGLQAHTDNPYRDPVPGLQILACLENDVAGGGTIVVDGFKVAERLLEETPRGFDLLSRFCARFEYTGEQGVRLRSKRPIIELGPDGELLAIRFNNRSAAPFTDIPFEAMADFYAAYRRMAELIEDPAMAIRFRLMPGDVFMVDNQRVLHAREPFAGDGRRWLRGCYADRDGLLSTLAILEAGAGA